MEPEANGTEILNALKYVRPGDGYVPNFQMFKIVDVNGKDEIPLYTYMKVIGLFRQHNVLRFWHNAYSSNEGSGELAHVRRLA